MAHSLRFYGDGVSFQVVSGQASCLAHRLTQGPSWWHTPSLSQDGSQREGFWEAGRLCPLLAPPKSSRLVFTSSTMFFFRTSCCETPQARGYHRAWPRQVVLVKGSLTTREPTLGPWKGSPFLQQLATLVESLLHYD